MSFNIKNSFVSRAIVKDDEEKSLDTEGEKSSEEVVIQEEYDSRTLFERLQEQRILKEEKFAEESRLSNQIKRVDAEEVEYFRTLSDEKEKLEYERKVKEQLELEEYRQAVEARSVPVGPAVNVITTQQTITKIIKPLIKSNKSSSLKGALFVKKQKRSHDDEEEDERVDKKVKTSNNKALSLLSAAYDDISSSSEEENS